jgi:hypothetical protein
MNRSLRPVAARIRPNNATISHRLRRLCLLLAIGLCLMHASASQGADGNAAGAEPPLTPRLQVLAEFTTKPRCPVYESGEPVSLWVAIDGRRTADEKLIWTVNDYQGAVRDKGEVAVPKGDARWSTTLAMGDYGAGYFEVHVSLKRSGETLPQMGTRPPGFAAYGVLPSIERQALARVDDSRFGAQGTNFVASGEIGKGDFVDPVYPLLGAKWIYLNRRLGEIFGKAADSYQPVLDPETFRKTPNYEAKAGLCLLVDLHSVPAWLADVPEGRSLSQEGGNAVTEAGQRYPPKDFGVYKSLVAKLVAEQTVRCATHGLLGAGPRCFPGRRGTTTRFIGSPTGTGAEPTRPSSRCTGSPGRRSGRTIPTDCCSAPITAYSRRATSFSSGSSPKGSASILMAC